MSQYVFFPDDLKAQIPKLYAQEGSKDPTVYMKLFTPWTGWTWFVTEGEDRDGDYLMFGYTIGQEKEWGYISMNELKAVRGPGGLEIERDIHFTPRPKSQVPEIKS
jgi:hypothetical protein